MAACNAALNSSLVARTPLPTCCTISVIFFSISGNPLVAVLIRVARALRESSSCLLCAFSPSIRAPSGANHTLGTRFRGRLPTQRGRSLGSSCPAAHAAKATLKGSGGWKTRHSVQRQMSSNRHSRCAGSYHTLSCSIPCGTGAR